MCDLRWGVEFVDPNSTQAAPGIWLSLPYVYDEKFDRLISPGSVEGTGRFHEIETMDDYKAMHSCVHVCQSSNHFKGVLGMLLM